MDRRSFIKRSALLVGLLAVNPSSIISVTKTKYRKALTVSRNRIHSWKDEILRLYPNESAPLTAMLEKMNKQGKEFSWWTK